MPRHGLVAAALIATSIAAPAAAEPAMHLSPTGTGQVLIYPYYTTHGGLTTVFTLGNPTFDVKAVRVRVLEGVNAKPVQQLNLYLSPFATFAAAIAPGGGDDQPARLVTQDPGCTVPEIPSAGLPFTTAAFTGPNQDWDAAGTPADRAARLASPLRTRDGHLEVIEMGVLRADSGPALAATISRATGRPANCGLLRAFWEPGGIWTANPGAHVEPPRGGLRGEAVVVEVAAGLAYGYAAIGIEDFYTDTAAPAALHTAPTNPMPDLRSARSTANAVRVALPRGPGDEPRIETFAAGSPRPDPVTLLLMASALRSEFSLDPALGSETEWVYAMPTRRWYVEGGTAASPFTRAFAPTGRACEPAEPMAIFRTGIPAPRQGDQATSAVVSPWRTRSVLCASTSVVAARHVARGAPLRLLRAREGLTGFLLGDFPGWSPDGGFLAPVDAPDIASNPVPLPPALFDDYDVVTGSGVLLLSLWTPNRTFVAPSGRAYFGLPVVGVAFTRYVNANAQPGLLANYGVAMPVTVEQRDRPPARPAPATW